MEESVPGFSDLQVLDARTPPFHTSIVHLSLRWQRCAILHRQLRPPSHHARRYPGFRFKEAQEVGSGATTTQDEYSVQAIKNKNGRILNEQTTQQWRCNSETISPDTLLYWKINSLRQIWTSVLQWEVINVREKCMFSERFPQIIGNLRMR